MTRSKVAGVFVVGLATVAFGETSSLSLQGIRRQGAETELYLAGGESARWMRVGERWGDSVLVGFDERLETAVVRDGGGTRSLMLRRARITASAKKAINSRSAIIAANLSKLAISACQHLLEQNGWGVRAGELVGAERTLFRLEPASDETYDDVSFSVGVHGIELSVDGATIPVSELPGPLVIQVQPTHSLATISEHLQVPLAELRRLNPKLAPTDRFTAIESVRLH